jgi:hypothetical protein
MDTQAPIRAAVGYALSKNATVVAGAFRSRDGETDPIVPAAEPGVIGVGALDVKGHRMAKLSGRNSSVIIGAPGFTFPSIGPGNTLWTMDGTLPASAWVASTAALVRAEHPRLPQAQVAQAITSSARHPASGYDTGTGFGIVNPVGALRAAEALEKNRPALVAGRGTVADSAHFGGPPPAKIQAVRHGTSLLAGFGGLAGGGLLAVVLAVILAIRGRRRAEPLLAAPPYPLVDGPPAPPGGPPEGLTGGPTGDSAEGPPPVAGGDENGPYGALPKEGSDRGPAVAEGPMVTPESGDGDGFR